MRFIICLLSLCFVVLFQSNKCNAADKNTWPLGFAAAFQHNKQCASPAASSQCVFPFEYKGQWNYDCLAAYRHCWCSLDRVYKSNGGRQRNHEYCTEPKQRRLGNSCPAERTVGRSTVASPPSECVFPFEFDGEWFTSCTRATTKTHVRRRPQTHPFCWCSTKTHYTGKNFVRC